MKRSSLISLIDVLAFISFLFLIATGLLLEFVLPAGSGGLESHGGGRGAGNRLVTLVWGLTRHEWGTIHFWVSITFLIVMGLHLFIHWRWIVVSFKGKNQRESHLQAFIGLAALLGLLALAMALILGPKEQLPRKELQQQRQSPATNTDHLQP